MTNRRAIFVLLTAVAAAGCATSRAIPLADAVPPGTASFALDPIPTPRRALLADRLLPAGPGEVDETVAALAGADPEAYEIEVREAAERTRIRIAAGGPAGLLYARSTLAQITTTVGGRRYVRAGRIEDAPFLPLRGSKRPLAFERRLYHANLAWEKPAPEEGWTRVPVLSPGGTLAATEPGIAAARAFFAAGHARGARRFAIEFDDVGYDLTGDARDRYGTYPRALVRYLEECRDLLRETDPGAALYWLPQTYWTDAPDLPGFAHALGRAGGLPADLGLVVTGPQVISEAIRAADVARTRRAFGLTRRGAVIYDNLGREGDHGPMTGREPSLALELDGLLGERGEVLFRITRLDWCWNPFAYDPARSHLLACREVVGAAAAPALSRLIREADRLGPAARAALLAEVRAKLDPPARAPVDARALLDRIRTDLRPAGPRP